METITLEKTMHITDGSEAHFFRINGKDGAYMTVLDYGAAIQRIVVPDSKGNLVDVVLGFDEAVDYENGHGCFGATVGRVANRIGGAQFTLNGETFYLDKNIGDACLHSGFNRWNKRLYRAEIAGDVLKMHLLSPDGDQGFPGEMDFTVAFSFNDNVLEINYTAVSTKDTLINVTNHSYFDLSGGIAPKNQLLQINADYITENSELLVPTGKFLDVKGTPFDFTKPKCVTKENDAADIQLERGHGYDHNFVLRSGREYALDAILYSPETGIVMESYTDMPGVQFYGNNGDKEVRGKDGKMYGRNSAVCLEMQMFPNAINIDDFESPILKAGETYTQHTTYKFKVK